jgi:hypothetical protein
MPADAPSFLDDFNRPFAGTVTIEYLDGGPGMTLELDGTGTVSANLNPGVYILGARLRTPENYIAYITERMTVDG